MEYWTYRIKDSRGEEVIDYIGKDLKTEKEARLAAIGDVQTALKRARTSNSLDVSGVLRS